MSADSRLLPGPLESALPGTAPPDNGLGGKLVVRMPRGGCGNALILIVFRIVFPAPFTPAVVLSFGKAVLPPGVAGLRLEEGARRPLFGRLGVEAPGLVSERVGMLPVLFRVFAAGNAGNGDCGGPYDGLDGRGRAAAIVGSVVGSFGRSSWCKRTTNMIDRNAVVRGGLPRRGYPLVHESRS